MCKDFNKEDLSHRCVTTLDGWVLVKIPESRPVSPQRCLPECRCQDRNMLRGCFGPPRLFICSPIPLHPPPRPCHSSTSTTHPPLITMYVICLIESEDLHLLQGIHYLFPLCHVFWASALPKPVDATRTMPKPPSSTFPNCTLPILHTAQIHPNHQKALAVCPPDN